MNSQPDKLSQLRNDIASIGKNRPVSVLVVDDDDAARLLIRDLLSGYNVRIQEADNGVHALEALSLFNYDVVLLDVKMPDMDGITVRKEIKEKWPAVKVFLCTGYPEWPGVEAALEDGFLMVISKNFLEKSLSEIFEPLCTKTK